MKFTPIAVTDIPEAVRVGRSSPAKTLIQEFIESDVTAAKVDLNGSKAPSAGSNLRKWVKELSAPVEVRVVGEAVYLLRVTAE